MNGPNERAATCWQFACLAFDGLGRLDGELAVGVGPARPVERVVVEFRPHEGRTVSVAIPTAAARRLAEGLLARLSAGLS